MNAFLLAYGVMYMGPGLLLDRLGSRTGLALFVAAWPAPGTVEVLAPLSASMFGVGIWAGNLHAHPADAFAPGKIATRMEWQAQRAPSAV